MAVEIISWPNLHERMLPDPGIEPSRKADMHPTELSYRAQQSQSLGWTKHFTSYKPKVIDPMMYFFFSEGWGE